MKSNKILIIFETSVIRNPNHPYKEVNLGSIFGSIKQYITDKNLEKQINLAITKFTIDELLVGRNGELEKDSNIIKKIEGLPNVNLLKNNFNYHKYLEIKINWFIKNNGLLVIPYPLKSTFYGIIKRSLWKKKPFIQTKKHSDYGFKDAIIWESILNFNKIKNFKKVILIAGDNGFDETCEKEFADKHNCFFKIFKDHTSAIKEIETSLTISHAIEKSLEYEIAQEEDGNELPDPPEDEDLRDLLQSEYFKDGLMQFVIENSDGNIKKQHIKIVKLPVLIEDWVIDDEVYGKVVWVKLSIKGIIKDVAVFLDEVNGIDKYEIND